MKAKHQMSKDLYLHYVFTDRGGDLVYDLYHIDDAKTRQDRFGRIRIAPDLMLTDSDQIVNVKKLDDMNGSD